MRAAWALLAVLGLLAGPDRPEPSPACARPATLRSAAGAPAVVGCRAAGAGTGARVSGAAGLLFGAPLDLNRASADGLEALPGIGPARAAAIVAERSRRPFERVSDLQRVHGIGPRSVQAIDGLVRVGPRR